MLDLAFKHLYYGFKKLFAYLRRESKSWNHKKGYKIYKLLKLNKRRQGKKKVAYKNQRAVSKTSRHQSKLKY